MARGEDEEPQPRKRSRGEGDKGFRFAAALLRRLKPSTPVPEVEPDYFLDVNEWMRMNEGDGLGLDDEHYDNENVEGNDFNLG